jgi:hypothetical protein
MVSVNLFNDMLKAFMQELTQVFPEEKQIALFVGGFDALTLLNPNAPLDMFLESLSPYSALVMARDPALFDHLVFPGGIDFGRLWSADLSDETRDAIWQHINGLLLVATALRSLPPHMMQTIDMVGNMLKEKFGDDLDTNPPDFGEVLQTTMSCLNTAMQQQQQPQQQPPQQQQAQAGDSAPPALPSRRHKRSSRK